MRTQFMIHITFINHIVIGDIIASNSAMNAMEKIDGEPCICIEYQ
jgi:hypothetical protein